MSVRLAKRREGIVSLTHTEIMLVLATVILLLLLVKSVELTKTESQLAEERERVSALEEETSESAQDAAERKAQVDFAEEVKAILVSGGVAEESAESARLAEAVSVLVVERRRGQARDAAVKEALIQAEMLEDNPETEGDLSAEKIKRMGENAAIGKAAREALNDDAADADSVKGRIDELKEAEQKIAALDGEQLSEEERRNNDLRSKIGCVPCWLREGEGRKYYYAYDITYHADTNSFSMKPHRDWKSGAKVVADALSGELSILKDYPRGLMTENDFLIFGRRIAPHKNRRHGEECRLMATLNEESNGLVIKFVRDKVKFCPII